MDRTGRRLLVIALAAAAAAFVAVAIAAVAAAPELVTAPGAMSVLLGVGLFVGLSALSAAWIAADQHFDDLERLRGDLLTAAAGGQPLPRRTPPLAGEVGRLAEAAAEALKERAVEAKQAETRLQAVVAAAGEGIIVVTDTGLISLVNAAAYRALGAGRLQVGTSIYGALDRDGLVSAAHATRADGRPRIVRLCTVEGSELPARLLELPDRAGMVLFLPGDGAADEPVLHHDLTLHDRPPPAAAGPDTPLAAVPALALDLETTGLDPQNDRAVAIGAVRLHGLRIYRHVTLDRLVDPGVPVPRRATQVHGITSAMLRGAPPLAEIWPDIAALMRGVVVIGHNIGFDLTVLAREAERIGVAWRDPPSLDTALLAAALEPRATELDLESVAQRLGVAVEGRHTALGDALLAAEVFVRLVPRLADRGVRTVAQASAFAARARRLGRLQQAAGWRPAGVR